MFFRLVSIIFYLSFLHLHQYHYKQSIKIKFCDKFFINISPSAIHFDDFNGQNCAKWWPRNVLGHLQTKTPDSGSDGDVDGSAECVARHLLHSAPNHSAPLLATSPCRSALPKSSLNVLACDHLKCSKCHHWLKRGAINIYVWARSYIQSGSAGLGLALYGQGMRCILATMQGIRFACKGVSLRVEKAGGAEGHPCVSSFK